MPYNFSNAMKYLTNFVKKIIVNILVCVFAIINALVSHKSIIGIKIDFVCLFFWLIPKWTVTGIALSCFRYVDD